MKGKREEETKEMKEGTDGNELYVDRTEKEKAIRHNGKIWRFKYRELTWAEKNRAISAAGSIDENKVGHFDVDKYNRVCLSKMLTETPFKEDLGIALIKLDPEVGNQLAELVPSTSTIVEEKEEDFTGAPSEAI